VLNIGLLLKLEVPTVTKVFIDIGTCDFDTSIPLAEAGWRGYMVEADPKYASTMSDKTVPYDVDVFNMAISNYDGELDFVTAEPSYDDAGYDWKHGMGHVASSNHDGNRMMEDPRNDHFIGKTIKIGCLTLDSFIRVNDISKIDFLKIDVEGHEKNILEGFSWSVKPSFLKIEHFHSDKEFIQNVLIDNGYFIFTENYDIYGILK